MLRRSVEQILSLYNYIDGIVVTDKNGYIEYFYSYRPDVNNLREEDVLGKHVLEIYPTLTEETSSILRVLRTGKHIFNEYQVLKTYKGQSITAVNTTMPLKNKDEIVGVVDVSRYIDSPYERQDILISLKEVSDRTNLYTLDDILTKSKSMELVKEKIKMIADTDSSVLIYGETGTGKELVAQAIHTASNRRNKRFISQNCAAIPGTLLESVLFGTTKGSYTGAENKPGLFEMANGGTLFLDEINSMEIGVQAKILKAIEEKKVTRIGGYEPISTNIKIVSALNENPMTCIAEKRLREDLFYRISIVQLNIPPLRDRINDLSFLISQFIEANNDKMNRKVIGIDENVTNVFKRYNWPGNVRELKNVIEGAFNLTDLRVIEKKDLPEYLVQNVERNADNQAKSHRIVKFNKGEFSLEKELGTYEKSLIIQALDQSKNFVDAAELLGITKQALNYKMGKFKINYIHPHKSGRVQ